MTPKPLDNTAIETEVRKNLTGDGITGIQIDVNNGVVTLKGNVKTSSDRQKAYDDAAKVNGVKRVINRITVG
jgi:osmotically-inducible protein OsmY